MPVGTPVLLAEGWSGTDLSTYTVTPSRAPVRGRLLLLFHDTSHGSLASPTGTPTGLGLIWAVRNDLLWSGSTVRRSLSHTAPVTAALTSGDITITMTGNTPSTGTGWCLLEIPGVDLASPVVRTFSVEQASATSASVTMPRPLSVGNRWVVFTSHRTNEVTSPRSGWAELSDIGGNSPIRGGEVQWLAGTPSTATGTLEGTASASWATSSNSGLIGVELRAAQPSRLSRRRGRR